MKNLLSKSWFSIFGLLGFLGFLKNYDGTQAIFFFAFFAFFAFYWWAKIYRLGYDERLEQNINKVMKLLVLFLFTTIGIGCILLSSSFGSREFIAAYYIIALSCCSIMAPAITYYIDRRLDNGK